MVSLKNSTVAQIRAELARREVGASRLAKRRDKLARKLAVLDAELADLGVNGAPRRGRPPGRKPGRRGPGRPKGSKKKRRAKRAKNSMSLIDAIVAGVRKGATVSPAEAGAAAKRKGYRSSSPNFGMMVANALSKAPQFKRLGRGQYVLKARAAAPKAKRGRPAKKGRRGPGRPKASRAKLGASHEPDTATAQ